MKSIRIPLAILALISFFVAFRYFQGYAYSSAIIAVSYLLLIASFLTAGLGRIQAEKASLVAEKRSWNMVFLWKGMFLLGMVTYQLYRWSLGDQIQPDSLISKLMLTIWLSLMVFGGFLAIGVETAFRLSGQGKYAEPDRVVSNGFRWLGIGLFLGFLVTLNYSAVKLDKAFDWSYFKTTKPGEATENVVRSLSAPVEVAAFFGRDNEVGFQVRQYLEQLSSLSSEVKFVFLDKDFAPVQAERFRAARNGQIVLMRDNKRQRIEIGETLESARKNLQSLDAKFQQALLALIEEKKNIYLTQGHGEMTWRGRASNPWRSMRELERLLRLQNYNVRELALTTGEYSEVPADAAAVAIVGPSFSFSQAATEMIRAYVEAGGKLLVFLDIEFSGEDQEAINPDQDSLTAWLDQLGISFVRVLLANDRTFMRHTNQAVDHGFLATNNFSSHEAVSRLAQNEDRMGVITYQSGYFEVGDGRDGWRVTSAVRSLATTFNDRNRNYRFDAESGEVRQAYSIGVAAQKDSSQIFAFADATMIADPIIRNPGNQFAVSEVLKWLVGDQKYSGATESEEDVKIQHSKSRELFVFHGSIYAIPILVLLAGFLATRRKKGINS